MMQQMFRWAKTLNNISVFAKLLLPLILTTGYFPLRGQVDRDISRNFLWAKPTIKCALTRRSIRRIGEVSH